MTYNRCSDENIKYVVGLKQTCVANKNDLNESQSDSSSASSAFKMTGSWILERAAATCSDRIVSTTPLNDRVRCRDMEVNPSKENVEEPVDDGDRDLDS
jgi:hypothetical protein